MFLSICIGMLKKEALCRLAAILTENLRFLKYIFYQIIDITNQINAVPGLDRNKYFYIPPLLKPVALDGGDGRCPDGHTISLFCIGKALNWDVTYLDFFFRTAILYKRRSGRTWFYSWCRRIPLTPALPEPEWAIQVRARFGGIENLLLSFVDKYLQLQKIRRRPVGYVSGCR